MKKILTLSLICLFLFNATVFANEICVVSDMGKYKIVAEKYNVTAPHGTVYSYKNYGVLDENGNVVVQNRYNKSYSNLRCNRRGKRNGSCIYC